jgi:hypothetical protein
MESVSREKDPGLWGHSLANAVEILTGCLDVANSQSVVEVGAYAGDLTEKLLEWGISKGARITAIDPKPADELIALAGKRPELDLVKAPSLEALGRMPTPDAVVIDGDHNYFTVSEELRVIDKQAGAGELPLLIFHDVGWPHARRDSYYAPERIPAEHRTTMVEGVGVFPGRPGVTEGALPYKWAAAMEGGPGNGVLTAIEDFLADRPGFHLAIVPVFFGLGVVWSLDASYAKPLASYLSPWENNPVLERLEGNRVFHLANEHVRRTETWLLEVRLAQQERILRTLLESRAFAFADRLSQMRNRHRGESWRQQIIEAMKGDPKLFRPFEEEAED